MNIETGTLAELKVKAGDVVRHHIDGKKYEIRWRKPEVLANWCLDSSCWGVDVCKSVQQYTIVSRAAPAADTPVLWRDMTPAEKGEMLLAAHEGKVIEHVFKDTFIRKIHAGWANDVAYRVKPEPVAETVTLHGAKGRTCGWSFGEVSEPLLSHTHRITFNLIDGKSDVASIKMEEL